MVLEKNMFHCHKHNEGTVHGGELFLCQTKVGASVLHQRLGTLDWMGPGVDL